MTPFREAYVPEVAPERTKSLTLQEALDGLARGHRVRRMAWTHDATWTRDANNNVRPTTPSFLLLIPGISSARPQGKILHVTCGGTLPTEWLPSYGDLVANDWLLIPHESNGQLP